jgi:hypothetical protein
MRRRDLKRRLPARLAFPPPEQPASQPPTCRERERERDGVVRGCVDCCGAEPKIFGTRGAAAFRFLEEPWLPRGGRGGAKISLQPARWGAPVTTTTPYPPPVRGWMDGPRMCGGPEVDAACWPWNCYGPVILD